MSFKRRVTPAWNNNGRACHPEVIRILTLMMCIYLRAYIRVRLCFSPLIWKCDKVWYVCWSRSTKYLFYNFIRGKVGV